MFNVTTVYEENIEPLVNRLNQLCTLYGIPFFCSACIADDGKESIYRNSMNGSISMGVRLTDDQITKHVNVANGFDTYPKRDPMNFEAFDDIEDDLDEELVRETSHNG